MTEDAIRWLWRHRHDDPFIRLLLRRELRELATRRRVEDQRWEWRFRKQKK